jgi:Protein of unknown function (DUF2865)
MLASRPFSRRTLVAERMAMVSLRIRAALLMGLLASLPQPTQAQSLPHSIFGYGSRVPNSPYRLAPGGFFSPTRPGWDEPAQHPEMVATYRTLCVRLCDGFYFPISPATPQSRFARDADVCSASCGAEARLFYHPNVGGNVDTMVDLTGMAYSALPNAFKYRQALVPSCGCRPQPWAEAERERHRAYAEGQLPDAAAPPPRLAAAPSRALDDDPRAIPEPPPLVQEVYPAPSYVRPYRR